MNLVNEVLNKLQHVDPVYWTIVAAYLAPYAQELLKGVRDFSERANYVLALLVIPGVIAVLAGLGNSHLISGLHPVLQWALVTGLAALIGQLKYGLSLNPRLKQKAELQKLKSSQSAAVQIASESTVVPVEVTAAEVPVVESGY